MESFKYENNIFKIQCSNLSLRENIEIAIENALVAINSYRKKKHGKFINIEFANSEDLTIDLWGKVIEIPEYYSIGEKYLQGCINRLKKNKFLYENDETPLAGKIAYKLAMTDKLFIPYYSKLLYCWDMNHEVNVFDHITNIVSHYGWCEEIEELIIARLKSGGQHSFQQFQELEDFIRKNNEPLIESVFFRQIVEYFYKLYGDSYDWLEAIDDLDDCSWIFGGMTQEATAIMQILEDEK